MRPSHPSPVDFVSTPPRGEADAARSAANSQGEGVGVGGGGVGGSGMEGERWLPTIVKIIFEL